MCCHVGGDIDFDAAGNLYLSTGDDTNPFDSAGYAPIDERADRNPAFDAQRTSGNSNDLRGKVLRIKPGAAGGYTIPAGNMFAPGTANTRPEVYAMGFRNPFRMSVDKATGVVYLGDYGPDAGTADPQPRAGRHGRVRADHPARLLRLAVLLQLQHPLPRVHVPQRTVVRAVQLRRWADEQLAQQHRHHHAAAVAGRPGCPTAAARTRRTCAAAACRRWAARSTTTTPRSASDVKFPASYERQGLRSASSAGRWIKTVTLNASPAASARSTRSRGTGTQVMDMEFGPDGALYVLDYGTGWFGGDANSARLPHRVQRPAATGHRSPGRSATPTGGTAPLTVQFSSAGTHRPGRRPDHLRVGLHHQRQHRLHRGQPVVHLHGQRPVHRDADGPRHRRPDSATASVVISVGRPTVSHRLPAERPGVQLRRRGAVHRSTSPIRNAGRSTAPGSRSTTSSATTATVTRSPA